VQAAVNPYTTCFSHCTAWLLENIGIGIKPDTVTREINGSTYEQFVRNTPGLGAWALSRYRGNLNQLWQVQEKYINDKLNKYRIQKKARFNASTDTSLIKTMLVNSPVIVNTSPVYNGQRLGHIMLIVGYEQDKGQWVVDDPFGDFRTGYSTGHVGKGNAIFVSVSDFEKIRGKMSIYVS
jgi:hypothetical protein